MRLHDNTSVQNFNRLAKSGVETSDPSSDNVQDTVWQPHFSPSTLNSFEKMIVLEVALDQMILCIQSSAVFQHTVDSQIS